ncbi:netrin receptor DCC [Parasponia andersonii]|uniref:Netrin receptor DCC n=1 Tax=Parasponia andersonii TaxID=3476 RepID=A0A2P5DDR0_PARAD|nr:netrin receptor DCC [Parasponia andersonii]
MPTFTALALDTLLEPGASKSVDKSVPRPVPKPKPGPNSKLERRNSTSVSERRTNRPPITPALYATPEATPLPDSPTSFPPSPYIINHKRRGPRLLKSSSESNVLSRQKGQDEEKVNGHVKNAETKVNLVENDSVTFTVAELVEEPRVRDYPDCGSSNGKLGNGRVQLESRNGKLGNSIEESGDGKLGNSNEEFVNGKVELGSSSLSNGPVTVHDSLKQVTFTPERESEREDFFDPQESMSFTSNTDGEDDAEGERSLQLTTPMGEFFDAWDELSSESGQQPVLRDVEAELREMRLSVLTEIEKRKQAEEALSDMQKQWQRIRQQLSLVGLTLPAEATPVDGEEQLDSDTGEELCRQVYIARFVSNSIGRGLARAEVEKEMEAQIEAKNFEIARLCDKLRNYEAMNQEMVQRNRDVLELARRERVRRERRRQRWIWGSIASALTLGTVALAWSYLPSGTGSPTPDSQVPQSEGGAK